MRKFLVLTVLAALLVLGGCCAGNPCADGGGGVSASASLPPLSVLLLGPPKPVCIPEGRCVAAYGKSWQVLGPCGEKQGARDVTLPMEVVERMSMDASPSPSPSATPECCSEPAVAGYPRVLSRTVTRYEGDPDATAAPTPPPADSPDSPDGGGVR